MLTHNVHALSTSLLNRRDLLIERIKTKYPDSYDIYHTILHDLDIIK
jgi:hypothetical protein